MPEIIAENRLEESPCDLINKQLDEWQLFIANYNKYREACFGKIIFDNVPWKAGKILLNYRKGSITADLKAIGNGERPCFLCKSARPEQQRWIDWEDYEILVNPYPVSSIHFTIASKKHAPQILDDRIVDMVKLTRIFQNGCVFYNGAKCGASAPDHMHFQVVDTAISDNFTSDLKCFDEGPAIGDSKIYMPHEDTTPFGYYLMEINSDKDIIPIYKTVVDSLPVNGDSPEPMMNVIAFRMGDTTRVVVIPRKKHRPSIYGSEAGMMLISPASIEMTGTFITSRHEDFGRLDNELTQMIYNEVGYTHDEFMDFKTRLQS